MRNRWIKSHGIDTKVSWNRMDETSSNNVHLDWKVHKIGTFQSFFLLREIVLRLILKHFPYIPRKENSIEIPVEL